MAPKLRNAAREIALRALAEGEPLSDVARVLGITARTLQRWIKPPEEATPPPAMGLPGAPMRLDEHELIWLAQSLRDKLPRDFGVPLPLWTPRGVQTVVANWLGKAISASTVRRYLDRLGIVARHPIQAIGQDKPGFADRWCSEYGPALNRRAKANAARLMFVGAERISPGFYTRSAWHLTDERVIDPFPIHVLTATTLRGDYRFRLSGGDSLSRDAGEFVRLLKEAVDRPLLLVAWSDEFPSRENAQKNVLVWREVTSNL